VNWYKPVQRAFHLRLNPPAQSVSSTDLPRVSLNTGTLETRIADTLVLPKYNLCFIATTPARTMDSRQLIDAQFDRAVEIVSGLPKTGPIQTGYEEKLTMYRYAR
jgi:hypothetical protein